MEESCPHFDSDLGGCQSVPNAYNLSDFMKERMEEIVMLTETIKESPFRGQTFQRLPKHMRRRQMSHYIKRLPRRLQRPHLLTLQEGVPAPSKCPSRKYRRRSGNLLTEYNRRQRLHTWLETHIWHAKRFHMVKKWGYSLPEAPTNKSFRACYRALSRHCLITDISYFNCIELKGPEEQLLKGLMQCSSPNCGLTFGAKTYLSGTREGSLTFFHPNKYPNDVIGTINFMWRTPSSRTTERTIWIWVHPVMHDEIVDCLITLFDLKLRDGSISEGSPVNGLETKSLFKKKCKKKYKNKIELIKLEPKNIPFSRMPKYENNVELITMTLLKDTLNRFQLKGPLSQAIITQAFQVAQVCSAEKSESEIVDEEAKKKRKIIAPDMTTFKLKKTRTEEKLLDVINGRERWWQGLNADDVMLKNWSQQKDFYCKLKKCSGPTDVPSDLILSLVISDPRLLMPSKREKALPESTGSCQIQEDLHATHLSDSPIWNSHVRDEVSLTKLSTQEINEARSKKIVPGYGLDDVISDDKKSRIPILLVQKPGIRDPRYGRVGFGSGWDIISPAGYGMPIWQALIFRGARSGGLRETELLHLETNGINNFVQPDSLAGTSECAIKCSELKSRHFKLPPNKRPNYIKLGVPNPFLPSWDWLVSNWITHCQKDPKNEANNEKFYVLRCKKSLECLNEVVENISGVEKIDFENLISTAGENALVPVKIECSGRGKPVDLALICLPLEQDLKKTKERCCPMEKLHEDKNESSRKSLKREHEKLLKSLRRKRRKSRSLMKETFANELPDVRLKWEDIAKSDSWSSEKHREEYKRKMESLWVPSPELQSGMFDVPTRKVMGFVIRGDYTFSKALSTALGYVSILALFELFKIYKETTDGKQKLEVLVRNRDQMQYRFGRVMVLH